MRQPQAKKLSELSDELRIAAENVAPIAPIAVAACWKLPIRPRRPAGACSTRNAAAPPHSPPVEKPWNMRQITSRIGAQKPDRWHRTE